MSLYYSYYGYPGCQKNIPYQEYVPKRCCGQTFNPNHALRDTSIAIIRPGTARSVKGKVVDFAYCPDYTNRGDLAYVEGCDYILNASIPSFPLNQTAPQCCSKNCFCTPSLW